ncbi:hypothetical protein IWQ61_009422 [Dispira simplex]|nr:hypothetical protein IWQ61_009422 [Dispira simplex]
MLFPTSPVLNLVFWRWTLDSATQLVLACLTVSVFCGLERLGSKLLQGISRRSRGRHALETSLVYTLVTTLRYLIMLAVMSASRAVFCTAMVSFGFAHFVCMLYCHGKQNVSQPDGYHNLEASPVKPVSLP